jgi:alkylhydroperoxidase family enzyme
VGRKAGLNDDKLRAVLSDDRTSFNDTERLVIELADAMTDTPADVSDDLYARLRKQFSEEQLMQLGAQIAFENYRARWNRIFNVESDSLYTPQPNKRKNHDQPECADVSPALRRISAGQFTTRL